MEIMNPEVNRLSGLFFIFAAQNKFKWICKKR
jgi:hypothetical protein